MTVKEWLNRGRRLNMEINALLEERRRAFELATKAEDRINELYHIKNEIMDAINRIENPVYRTLLIERYINAKTWEQVAKAICYGRRQTIRLHEKALLAIKDVAQCHFDM